MSRWLALGALLVCACAASLLVGPLPPGRVDAIVLALRATRLGAGIVAGACLAVAGALSQGLFRNPLASPSVIGVTTGASLGVQVALLAHGLARHALPALDAVPREFWLPIGGLAGALAALAALLALARGAQDLASVLLIGLVLAMLLSSLGGLILALGLASHELARALMAFGLGGLDATPPAVLAMLAPLAAVGLVAAWGWGRPLDLMLSGEREAASLGVDVRRVRRWTMAWTAALATVAVVLGGGVGFVCLIVPNALRAWLGTAHRPLVVASAIGGAALMTAADVCARAFAGAHGEIPLGVITGLAGAPFFLWFFRRERAAGRL